MTCAKESYDTHISRDVNHRRLELGCKWCKWLQHQDMWTQVGQEATLDLYTSGRPAQFCRITGKAY